MARLAIINKENKRLQLINKLYAKREKLKQIIKNVDTKKQDKLKAQLSLQKLPRNSSLSRYTRRCLITGRSRGVYRKFGLCRNKLREYAMHGDIPGLKKASW